MSAKHRARSRAATWAFPSLSALGALIFLLGLSLALYPSVASWFSQHNQSKLIEELNSTHRDIPVPNEHILDAREYNRLLVGGVIVEADRHKATGQVEKEGPFDYHSLLTATESGIMARLRIESIDVDLPIYHGTADDTLRKGVGHLRGTALPVGGPSQRSVLTAHRGLPEATLFNDLDKVEIGDDVVVEVFGEVLTYRIIDTQVIEPDDTESISVEQGKDLLSLITCTPLGVNTHRILVTGERVYPTPEADLAAAGRSPDIPGFPWWAVIAGVSLVAAPVYVWRAGYAEGRRKRAREDAAARD
ncbi:class C sortase [Trueperella bialowiezensis]|uniref:Sortase (Surface protein transpeptidase) n=1 Tax=Trueperella bialowiezensis TaxID=312285 RepID=A0A448PDJ2_9ACTO|nr:class C sortase [Trueperella bialowiezensis]VEI13006.1 Sortase (surface protein transpeptidase) [Trueperella bialowiezensis]